MSSVTLLQRVEALEAEVQRLKSQLDAKSGWKSIVGTFANDPMYLQAMKIGRKYRESTRPKPTKKRKQGNANP